MKNNIPLFVRVPEHTVVWLVDGKGEYVFVAAEVAENDLTLDAQTLARLFSVNKNDTSTFSKAWPLLYTYVVLW